MTYAVAAAFAVMCVCYAWFQRIKRTPGHSRTLEIAVKCGATAMAVLVAGLGAMAHGTTAGWLMLAGLAVCAAADGVLCVYFVPGGALFALKVRERLKEHRKNGPLLLHFLLGAVIVATIGYLMGSSAAVEGTALAGAYPATSGMVWELVFTWIVLVCDVVYYRNRKALFTV